MSRNNGKSTPPDVSGGDNSNSSNNNDGNNSISPAVKSGEMSETGVTGDRDGSAFAAIDADVIQLLGMLRKNLQVLVEMGRQRFGKLVDGTPNLAGFWFSDMPVLARAAADAQGSAPGLFPGVPHDSKALRDLEEQVRVTGEFLMYLGVTTDQITAIYNAGRKLLCDWTYGITDQVTVLDKLPYVPKDQKLLIKDLVPIITMLLGQRTTGKLATQDGHAKIKATADAKVADAEAVANSKAQEIAVLRGGSVPVQKPAPKPTTRRRPRTKPTPSF